MSNEFPEADEYDLSAIQEHIKQVAKREEALTLDIRLKAFKKNLPQVLAPHEPRRESGSKAAQKNLNDAYVRQN